MMLTRRLHPLSRAPEHRLIHAHGHLWPQRPFCTSTAYLHDHIQPLIEHCCVPNGSCSSLGQRAAEELVHIKSP